MNKREKSLEMTMLMTPNMANFSGENVHGGEILKILDQVAYACASRYTGTYVVTLSVDNVLFKSPIKVGSLVTFQACINYVGKTSMEVGIKVICEDIKKADKKQSNTAYFTMVALDEDGKPTAIPKLDIQTKEEKRRYEDALKRREKRKKE